MPDQPSKLLYVVGDDPVIKGLSLLQSIPIPELELRVSSNSGMELTTGLKYIHDNILSLCTTATVMNSIIELKQAYVCGAFVGRGFCPCTILSSRCFQYNT